MYKCADNTSSICKSELEISNSIHFSHPGHEMPDGPLFMNKESVSQALYREVVSRQSVQYKHGVLASVAAIFREAGCLYRVPFALGIGFTVYVCIASVATTPYK